MLKPISFSMLILVATVLAAGAVTAQDGPKKQQDKSIIATYYLKSASIGTASSTAQTVLEGMEGVRMATDERTNAIILSGPPEAHDLMTGLLKAIDSAPKEGVMVFPLEHVAPNDAFDMLGGLLDNSHEGALRLAFNSQTNSIIAKGAQSDLSLLTELIKQIDQPSVHDVPQNVEGNCNVRITWLFDANAEDIENDQFTRPSARLEDLVEGLKSDGIMKNPMVLMRYQATVKKVATEASSFTGECAGRFSNSDCRLTAQGALQLNGNGNFDLELSLQLEHDSKSIRVGSAVSVPENHPVAFSVSSDVGSLKSTVVVEIVDSPGK